MSTKSQKPASQLFTPDRIVLGEDFFDRPALIVARDLIGKVLVLKRNGKMMCGVVSESEAYVGAHDLASHSSKGLTPRTSVMFGPPGRWYVYFNYGMHWMLNVVTGKAGEPAAVLIRGVLGVTGPGRLTKAFGIDKAFNARPAKKATGLWMEDWGILLLRGSIKRTPRIGVDYAGPLWADKPYRFVADQGILTRMLGRYKFKRTMTFVAVKTEKKSKKSKTSGRD